MKQLKYGEIISSIKCAKNRYEEKHGILTNEIKLLKKEGNLAFFLADKSDNSKTLYFAFKPDELLDHWVWCCPNEEHIVFLTNELATYIKQSPISQKLNYKFKIKYNNKTEIKNYLNNIFGSTCEVKIIKEGNSTLLIGVINSHSYLFVAIKPSIRFYHWYLFFPSQDQIHLLTTELSNIYANTDSNNDLNRWG